MSVKPTRPFRPYSVYCSPCVDCGEEIESQTFPVPMRCYGCQMRYEERIKRTLRDKPNPVRSTTGL